MSFFKMLLLPLLNERGEIGGASEPSGTALATPEPAGNPSEPAGNPDDGGGVNLDGGQEPLEPQYYTADELRTLEPEKLDTSRIAPEHLPFYKSFQSNFTRKYEALASEKREFEAFQRGAQMQGAGQPKPQTEEDMYYQQFKADPVGFSRTLTNAARARVEAGEIGATSEAALILQEFNARFNTEMRDASGRQENEAVRGRIYQNASSDLMRRVPDVATTGQEADAWAEKEFSSAGLNRNAMLKLANPEIWAAVSQITGNPEDAFLGNALIQIKHILYQKANAGRTAAGKIDRTPPRTVPAGQDGGTARAKSGMPQKPTGDAGPEAWQKYLADKREWDRRHPRA